MRVTPCRSGARVVGAVVAALALLSTSACARGERASWRTAGSTQVESGQAGGSTPKKKAPGEFSITPATGAAEISVLDRVAVTAKEATLQTVSMTNAEGKLVKGELSADNLSWKSSEDLGYAKQYTVNASGLNSAGEPITATSTFTTLKPVNKTRPYLRANDAHLLKERQTYGVGQTIQVYFDEKVDKPTVQKLLQVTTSPATEGSWRWHSAQKAEWRPAKYWTPGTSVTVKADLYGKDLGNGIYGEADINGSFKIGPSRIAIADATTKMMQVYLDGALARTIPVSLGKGGAKVLPTGEKINYWTNTGPHVVLEKTPSTRMTSASYGVKEKTDPEFYDVDIKWTIKISNSGEYTHRADNHNMFGRANMSHGCVNMPPGQAEWFYNTFNVGDVVDVKNTPVTLGMTNGIGAWTVSYEQWKKGSAL
jgi:lipoprotein-anchoring transpeptidase ErfK/SrfK